MNYSHDLGLQEWYTENPDNAFTVRMFQSVAFSAADMVTEVYDELMQSLDDEMHQLLADLLIYLETTWIGVTQRGRRHRSSLRSHALECAWSSR